MDSRRGFVGKVFASAAALAMKRKPLPGFPDVPFAKFVEIGKPVTINRERIFVNPPMVRIGSGASQIEQVILVNNSGGDIRVWFPHGAKLFGERSVSDWSAPFLIPKDTNRTLYVKAEPREGKFEYNVYCDVIEDYAEGNSAPSMACP